MRIAQISDTHISADFPSRVQDLERCVAQINALNPLPDVVIHTGDISHDGLPEQYEMARSCLDALKMPWFVMVGNKDKRAEVRAAFSDDHYPQSDSPFVQYAVNAFPVRLICVDTLHETSNKGDLCQSRLDDLERMLAADSSKPTAIFMHHPPYPVPVGPDPVQFVSTAAAEACLEIIARHSAVCGLFCGHVHRPAQVQIGAVPSRIMTAVALDLRFGEEPPIGGHDVLYALHEIDLTTNALAAAG